MQNEILKYLEKHIKVPEALFEIIQKTTVIRNYKKGTILLKEGEIANTSYFILKGCMRSYYNKDGEDHTIDFYFEEQGASPFAYGKNQPSEHYLECMEDTIASINTPEIEKEMFERYPEFETVCRLMGEAMLSKTQESFAQYKLLSPEERYLALLKSPTNIIQRVPQYHLATYLGITPQSLSRLRSRLTKKL
jgi:CRP-like cAMP-binding protein